MSQSPESLKRSIEDSVQRALEEDLVPDGDLTCLLYTSDAADE